MPRRGLLAIAMARELDDAVLHLRFNEPSRIIVFRSEGDPGRSSRDALIDAYAGDWLVREIRSLERVFKRMDVTSRSLFALIEPAAACRQPRGIGLRRRPA